MAITVNKIAPNISAAAKKGVLNLGRSVQQQGSAASKLNNFCEGRGLNPGRGAFLLLIYTCTLLPRLLKARDKDERAEILRRDLVTITTICFAMKALKAGSCKLMAQKSGLPLTGSGISKDSNVFKKALGYFQQKGETAFSADDINANYSNINGKDVLTRFLNFVDENNGNVGKVLTFDRAKPKSLFKSQQKDGALTKAAKKLLGDNFDFSKSGQEIIGEIKKVDANNPAFADIADALKENKSNPVTRFANGITSKFETASLFAVAGFLGFGLPKLNEKMTKDKYFNKKDGGQLKTKYQDPNYQLPTYNLYSSLNKTEKNVFQSFLGTYNPYANQAQGQAQNVQ